MGSLRPQGHELVRQIEDCLGSGDLSRARRLLAELGESPGFAVEAAYLATWLLFLRGRLDAAGVAERLRDLLARGRPLPQAAALLEQAEQGRLHPPSVIPPDSMPPSTPPPNDPAAFRSPSTSEGGERPMRHFSPITGLDSLPVADLSPGDAAERPPAIPRAPGVPAFESNPAPPSYAPERESEPPEHDLLGIKSLLPRDAGRYSAKPAEPDRFESRPRRPAARRSRPPASVARGPASRPSIRSGRPPPGDPRAPSLLELASLFDQGRFDDVVAATESAAALGPDHALLRARALAGSGRIEAASNALERLARAPLLEPELRAAGARVCLEIGEVDRALQQAVMAHDNDPDRPLVRLTVALAAVRCARRRGDLALLRRAQEILDGLDRETAPLPALAQALRACILATTGDPERAISLAQRALGLDPRSADAVAAIAEASARLGRRHDAREAWRRLRDLSPADSAALAPTLAALGMEVADIVRSSAPPGAAFWPPAEVALSREDRAEAIGMLEDLARYHVARMTRSSSQSGLTMTANVAASFFTTAPVFAHFAPFDLSLFSLHRVAAALDITYGEAPRGALASDEQPLVLLLGAYLGETVRLAHEGRWEGTLANLQAVRITTARHQIRPFRIAARRLELGRAASVLDALGAALAPEPAAAWGRALVSPVAPPTPWDPAPWPDPSRMQELGRGLSCSVVGIYCEHHTGAPLDGSMRSLGSLDHYLDLVAPAGAAPEPEAAWTRRLAVLAGAYLGEVLRGSLGGAWMESSGAGDANDYAVRLGDGTRTRPVARVFERLTVLRQARLAEGPRTTGPPRGSR